MEIYARDIINACALMHDTVVEIKQMGKLLRSIVMKIL